MLKSVPDHVAEAASVGIDEALGDPSAFYADPDAILADDMLSTDQKRRFLAEWAQDLIDHQVAADEGMVPEAAIEVADEPTLLERINNALETLRDAADEERPGRTSFTRLPPR